MDFLKFWAVILGIILLVFGWITGQAFIFQWFIDLAETHNSVPYSMLAGFVGLTMLALDLAILFYRKE